MNKFISLLLIVCMLFSVTALAAETTFAGEFLLFDFGSDSRVDDFYKGMLLSQWEVKDAKRTETEDSWILTCTNIHEYVTSGSSFAMLHMPRICVPNFNGISFGAFSFNNGWGTYKPTDYNAETGEWVYGNTAAENWIGRNQFMKLRIKNQSDNERIGMALSDNPGSRSWKTLIFDVNANDTEFQTYIIDMAKAASRGTNKGDYKGFLTQWNPWFGNGAYLIDFWCFGSWSTPTYAVDSDITYASIQLGATVEIDYMIFSPTAEMAAQYKSIDEGYVAPETTTLETTTAETTTTTTESVVETTTTESIVETTTTESVVETTTTESIVETTTTDAVVDETTTEAVVDQTTAPQDNSTTTTEQNTDTDKDGGFPVWIIIVIVVVIGGGVAAFFVFKKK